MREWNGTNWFFRDYLLEHLLDDEKDEFEVLEVELIDEETKEFEETEGWWLWWN